MSNKDSDAKLAEYNRMIAAKENRIEELKTAKKNLAESFKDFNTGMTQGFFQLAQSYEKLMAAGSKDAEKALENLQEKASQINSKSAEHQDELSEAFSKVRQGIDDEIEDILRKRSTLSWD